MIAERFTALTSLSVLEKWILTAERYEDVESRADEFPVHPEVLAAIEARFTVFDSGETTKSMTESLSLPIPLMAPRRW